MTITLYDVWMSSTGLLDRFGLKPTLDASWTKCVEEQHEMIEALHEMRLKNKDLRRNVIFRAQFARESADVLVTLLNVAYSVGMTHEGLEAVKPLSSTWVMAETEGQTERAALMALSLATYPFYLQLIDIQSGDTTATLYGVGVYLGECIKALVSVVKGAGLTYGEFESAIEVVMFKNDKKDHNSHEVANGMICRKVALVEAEERFTQISQAAAHEGE